MKKLEKLSIDSGKIISNDELIYLRGGYGADKKCDAQASQCSGYCNITIGGTLFTGKCQTVQNLCNCIISD